MWHEARKQEKIIRGMIVDYRRRAERRRDFYEKIKADPTQFLQLHGRPCKIHLDPAVAVAGEGPAIMMPWQGDHDNMIDRFDVRAHLDYIPEIITPDLTADELSYEERNCNYERYRILAQNMFLGIGEEKFLHQLSVEERFGVTLEEKEAQKEKQGEKKGTGVAISYNYDENKPATTLESHTVTVPAAVIPNNEDKDDSDDESDIEIIDVDLSIDVNKVENAQAHLMNASGTNFGMQGTDLFSFLTGDAEDAEKQKQLIREEKEKAMFSGRKSRRERRAHRDKKLALRVVSPPHYAARPPTPIGGGLSPQYAGRSPSPVPQPEKITFITSFGGDEEPRDSPDKIPALVSYPDKSKTYAAAVKTTGRKKIRTPSPPRSSYSSYSRHRKSKSPRRSPSPWSDHTRSRSKLRSKSRSATLSRSRSRSRSRHSSKFSLRSKSLSRSPNQKRRFYSDSSSRSPSRHRSTSSYSDRKRRSSMSSSSSDGGRRRQNNRNQNNNDSSTAATGGGGNSGNGDKLPRYYGRKREGARSSSSELSIGSSDDSQPDTRHKSKEKLTGGKTCHVSNVVRSTGSAPKQQKEKLTAKERLKKKMQAQLSRQLRADMKAEAERLEREQQLQQERDDEMREMAIKIRRRQREMRHQRQMSRSSDEGDSSSSPHRSSRSQRNCSRDRDSDEKEDSPPRTFKPKPSRVPVWEHQEENQRWSPSRKPPNSKSRISPWERDPPPQNTSKSRFDSEPGHSEWDSNDNYRNNQHYGGNRFNRPYDRHDNQNSHDSRPFNNRSSHRGQAEVRNYNSDRTRDSNYNRGRRDWSQRSNSVGEGGQRVHQENNKRYKDHQDEFDDSHSRGESNSRYPRKLVDY